MLFALSKFFFITKNRKAIHFPASQMPLAGLEPARSYPLDFESSASANSATAALCSVFTEHTNHAAAINLDVLLLQVVRARADIDVEVKDARHGVEPCGELLVVKCFADAHAAALVVADIVGDGGLEPVGAVPGEIRICNEVRDLDM